MIYVFLCSNKPIKFKRVNKISAGLLSYYQGSPGLEDNNLAARAKGRYPVPS